MIRKFSGLKTVYLIVLLVFLYFDIQHLDMLGYPYYQVVDKYFGNTMILIYITLFLLYITELSDKKKKRDQYSIMIFGIYPLFLAVALFYFAYTLGIFTGNIPNDLEYQYLKLTIFQLDLGLFTSYLCSFVILAKDVVNQNIGFAVAGIYILSFLVYVLKNTFWEVVKKRSIERKIQREKDRIERENEEKIRIKEEKERLEIERIRLKVAEDERRIREAVEREKVNNIKFQKFAEANRNIAESEEKEVELEAVEVEEIFQSEDLDKESTTHKVESEEEADYLTDYPLFREAIKEAK